MAVGLQDYKNGDYTNNILRKILQNQAQIIRGQLSLSITGGGGSGTPGGSNGQIQYNNAGAFGGLASTGTGDVVRATSATLVTPALGTPTALVLTNATGLPVSTGLTGLGANVATFLATPSSANLASAVSDETGSGLLVFGTNPSLVGYTLTGAPVVTYTAMPALAVNVALPGNTYSATGNVTFTYSNATPTSGTRTILKITADGTDRTITIPSTWSINRNGNITSLLVAANSTLVVLLEYTGSRWEISGDPVATTGSGSYVLATSPALVTPTLGVASATSLNKWAFTAPTTAATLVSGADSLTYTLPGQTCSIGYKGIPQNSQSTAYTTVALDSGKHLLHPTADNNARTFTIDSNTNVPYEIGTAITFVNQINTLSIAITADTLTLYAGSGTGTTGTRTLAAGGIATAIKVGTNAWVISGVGLT